MSSPRRSTLPIGRGDLSPTPCVVSWSGGKDSALALLHARRRGYDIKGLMTMFSPETDTSRSHGLPHGLLKDQARALGLPLRVAYASWDDYEEIFRRHLSTYAEQGLETAVFGDIFLDDHRAWVERVCAATGLRAVLPLWGRDTALLAQEILDCGIRARICTVRSECLEHTWLGEPFDERFLRHVTRRGLDPCGEHGEYHTVVVAAPVCSRRLVIDEAEVEASADYGHWVVRGWHTETARTADPTVRPETG